MTSVIHSQKTALITGAASGVGFAIAKLCRSKGMHLALLDIDQDNLAKTKKFLTDLDPSLKTEAYAFDVADVAAWKKTAAGLNEIFPDIDLVVLNAGKAYKPQEASASRVKQWLDGEYWRKVGKYLHNPSESPTDMPRLSTRMFTAPSMGWKFFFLCCCHRKPKNPSLLL